MSHRAQQKAEARAAREAAEREAAVRASRRRRLMTFGGILGIAAAVLVVVLLAANSDDAGEKKEEAVSQLAMFDGIPQDGEWLGNPDAPVVVEEFADLQCPACAAFATQNLEPIVTDFVKPGDVRLRLRLVSILGEESAAAAKVGQAAIQQNKGWQFAETFYVNQGVEHSGYITDDFMRERAEEAGLDADKLFADRDNPDIADTLREHADAFDANKVGGTPGFLVGPRGGKLKLVDSGELASAINDAVEQAKKP